MILTRHKLAYRLRHKIQQSAPDYISQFDLCCETLLNHHCTHQQLFELFHEFGHFVAVCQCQGTVAYLKVDQFLFVCHKQDLEFVGKIEDRKSYVLCVFNEDETLTSNLRKVAYAGMHYSGMALPLSLFSIKALVFNVVNGPHWHWYRKGSDAYLYYDFLKDKENALQFNHDTKRYIADMDQQYK